MRKRRLLILFTGLCLLGYSMVAFAEGAEGKGCLTVYADPVTHARVTVYLQKDGTEDIGVEISGEGLTETELPYGSYRIYKAVDVEYPEGYELLEEIPLTYTLQASYPEDGSFVLDAEHPRASIGTSRGHAKFYFTYSENAATAGVLTEELVSADLLMEDARLQPVLTPEEEAGRLESFPTLGEEYRESMKAEIESICENEGIEPPDDERINPDGSYGTNPYGFAETEVQTVAAETEPAESADPPATEGQTQAEEDGTADGEMALLIKVSVICLGVLLLTAVLVIIKRRTDKYERR